MNSKKIAVIGLGYVGLPLAVEFGKKRTVVGFDINQHRINDLKNGQHAVNISGILDLILNIHKLCMYDNRYFFKSG